MKAFSFRLERLLGLRRLREEIAQRDFALAQKAVREQNQVLARLLLEEEGGKAELRSMKAGTLDLVRIRLQEGYLASLERGIRREGEKLQELARVESDRRRALTESRKGVRVLERYRDRQYRTWRTGVDRQEQKDLDEVAQQNPLRQAL
jgi:flagellar export protein FliJ